MQNGLYFDEFIEAVRSQLTVFVDVDTLYVAYNEGVTVEECVKNLTDK